MIYSEFIMDYSKLKKFHGKIENAHKVEEGKNLSCGDEVTLYFLFDGDKIVDVKFEGHGCAISQASTNVMIEQIIGKTKQEALEMMKNAENMMLGKEFDENVLGPIINFYDVKNYPMRVKCFLLPWKTLEIALKNE
ncbi:nitrogen fixation protein NifU [Fervidobacterium changbaicum]|uniref:SUF system NifU family Fe-S cluster assembly protein n=3 Tax=Fervidobacterium TaxID=2422 RepID=A0AAI8CLP5_FERIS|nr:MULTISPECIES: SUF system NifU family Fe-S cluster assembly protein [Fervidobacterium]AMW33239.1 SUF system NifU family Fe-S cluster assembly protein [Fervidobacterium islandicum]QAV33299.1 SUF system NifU family Fe-S cluster assembly protein [Fervidobacterium changbaicum]SDH07922.1 nitrogen fixation protein NifU [Fervidobacterium changbaicum]